MNIPDDDTVCVYICVWVHARYIVFRLFFCVGWKMVSRPVCA